MDGVYAILEVRPTVGQEFKVYYDQNFSETSYEKLYDLIDRNDTLSYDVLKLDYEVIVGGDVDVLGTRLSVYEGDIIITDSCAPKENDRDPKVRSEYVADVYSIYRLEDLLKDAKAYLKQFLKDGATDELNYENLDQNKIDAKFLERMVKDNRFRSDEQKQEGKQLERARIQKLCVDVSDFEKFLNTAPEDCFYRYTKYSCLKEIREGDFKKTYQEKYQKEIDEGRANAIYGINFGGEAFKHGKSSTVEYFKVNGKANSENSIMMAFNFLEHQPVLQFETISFMCTVIRECSNILN
jgi:hypothetical protein